MRPGGLTGTVKAVTRRRGAARGITIRLGLLVPFTVVLLAACGPSSTLPRRRVVEADIGGWWFRRYQHVKDVEIGIQGNPADAHTAVYARDSAVKAATVAESDVAVVFVTQYKTRKGVSGALASLMELLSTDEGYKVAKKEIGGRRVMTVSQGDEAWAFWASGRYIVKIGGRGVRKVPSGLVKRYSAIYP